MAYLIYPDCLPRMLLSCQASSNLKLTVRDLSIKVDDPCMRRLTTTRHLFENNDNVTIKRKFMFMKVFSNCFVYTEFYSLWRFCWWRDGLVVR